MYIHPGCFIKDTFLPDIFAASSRKQPLTGFTLGHLVTKLVVATYRLFRNAKYGWGTKNKLLSALIGADVFSGEDVQVTYAMVYIVAVRPWQDRQGRVHYFPELEVRL